MLSLAFGIFGFVCVGTGACLLLMALYTKFFYGVRFDGLKATSAKPGGTTRFVISGGLSATFAIVGATLSTLSSMGMV